MVPNNRGEASHKVPKFGVRHVMTLLLFSFLLCLAFTRTTLSLAIVAMTDRSASANPDIPTFSWVNTSIILSSFFWTYIMLQPFAGYIFIRLGLKWVTLVTTFINSVAFISIPFVTVRFGSNGLIVCRLIQGLCQGFFFPASHTAIGLWVPSNERSFLTMVISTGSNMGIIIAMLVTGYVSASWWGWPAVFYILGAFCVIWCLLWLILAADSPATHMKISNAERIYIERSLETQENDDRRSVPFKAIFTSLPFWALVVANIGYSWGCTIIETQVPTYLRYTIGFNITENGAVTASPQILQLLINIPLGPLGDYLVSRKYVSLWTWRRSLHIFGSVVPSLALIWLSYISKDQRTLAIILLNIAIGTNAVMLYSCLINHVDLSPKYAGVLLSIENTISQSISMFAPVFIQYVVTDLSRIDLWRSVFLSLSSIMMATSAFFVRYGSADVQWWNSKKRPVNHNVF